MQNFLDLEAQVSDDNGEGDKDDPDLREFFQEDDDAPLGSSARLPVGPPDIPIFKPIFARYGKQSSSSSFNPKSSTATSSNSQPAGLISFQTQESHLSSSTSIPSVLSPPTCWNLLRSFASSEMSIIQVEQDMRDLGTRL